MVSACLALQDLCYNTVACFALRILLLNTMCTTSKNHSSVIVGCARLAYDITSRYSLMEATHWCLVVLPDLCHNVVACFDVRILLFNTVCSTSKNHSSVIVGCARVAYYLKVLSCGSCSSLVLACAIHNATLHNSVHVCCFKKLVSCPAAVSDSSKNVVANAAWGEDAFMHQGVDHPILLPSPCYS